jgi:predicted PurR-regulated permease PerM
MNTKTNRKGNMTLVFVFLASSVILIILAGLFSPMLVNFSTIITESGDGIMRDAQPSLDNIENVEIRNQINQSLNSAIQSSADNISILAGFYQYAWVIILIVSGIIIFLFARLLVETGGRGGIV